MNLSKASNFSLEVGYCDLIEDFTVEFKTVSLVQIFVVDLICGMLATGFVIKFYQGIEVSHPIYSVLFTEGF
jgi:hypothetical protein